MIQRFPCYKVRVYITKIVQANLLQSLKCKGAHLQLQKYLRKMMTKLFLLMFAVGCKLMPYFSNKLILIVSLNVKSVQVFTKYYYQPIFFQEARC